MDTEVYGRLFAEKRRDMYQLLPEKYYIKRNNNCAEAMLHIADDLCGLNLNIDAFKLVGAFGGGMGCGLACGALCGSLAALGEMYISESAHETEGFRELCAEYVESFQSIFGHTDCRVIKPKWFHEDGTRCIEIIEKNTELFERFIREHRIKESGGIKE